MQDESAVRVANLALSFCASSAFCFWKSAGAAAENAARARTTNVENLAEIMSEDYCRGWKTDEDENVKCGCIAEARYKERDASRADGRRERDERAGW